MFIISCGSTCRNTSAISDPAAKLRPTARLFLLLRRGRMGILNNEAHDMATTASSASRVAVSELWTASASGIFSELAFLQL